MNSVRVTLSLSARCICDNRAVSSICMVNLHKMTMKKSREFG